MDNAPRTSRLNLAVLVEIARTVERREALAQAICAHAVAGLGLAGASISIVRRDTGAPRLDSIAAVGQLSSFMVDMSTPLDKLTDASRTALGGEAIFVGNPHGVQDDAGQADGVGRWRNGFNAHAYAVLALTVLEGTIGVLTLEWPEPHPFEDADRSSLKLFADVVALVLRTAPSEEPAIAPAEQHGRPCEDAELAAFHTNARGLVVSEAVAASWGTPPAARVWTAVTPAHPADESVAIAEVTGVPGGGIVMAVGAVSAGPRGGAREAVAAGRGVMHAAAAHASSPGEILGMLGSSMRAQASAAWASGVVATFSASTGAMEIAEAGAVALVILGRGERFDVVLPDAPPVGTGRVPPPSRMQLALPGDRIALLSGRVSALTDRGSVSEAQLVLANLTARGGEETASSLLALVCAEGVAAAVAVLEVAEAPAAEPAE
jgi:hypothetical protein